MYIRNLKTSPKIRKQRVIANNPTMKIKWNLLKVQVQFSSFTQSCLTPCNSMDCSTPGFPVHHQLPGPTQTHVHCVGDATQSSHPLSYLLLPPSIFPTIRVFSSDSVIHIRWPKYWSFSFSISPSNEYSGLISFRIDWLDLLTVQGTFSSTPVQKHQFFGAQLLYGPALTSIHDYWKNHSLD